MKPTTQYDMFGRKECSQCRRLLPVDGFVRDPRKARGITSNCKECRAKVSRRYNKRNAAMISARNRSPETRAYMRAWWASNGDAIRERRRAKAATPEGRAKMAAAERRRRLEDTQHRVKMNIRSRVNMALKNGGKSATTEALIGCTITEFIAHIESRWAAGMSWANYGRGRSRWQIDHIKPCASFDLTDPDEQRACFHFGNCQPLWTLDNLSKGHQFVKVDS